MNDVCVRQFGNEDTDFAHKMTLTEEWNVTRNDVVRMRARLPSPNKSAIRVLSKHGFSQYSKSIRMTFGKRIVEQPSGIFAIGGAMKG